jgi:hypothetical protein
MKPTYRLVVSGLALAAAVMAGLTEVSRAEEPQKPALPGSPLSFTKFYTGPIGRKGTFPGKLLCLCCDLMPATAKAANCDANGHHHVLLLEDGLHPLIAGSEAVTKQMNDDALHGKQVIVTGNYYPATGYIFVDKIQVE